MSDQKQHRPSSYDRGVQIAAARLRLATDQTEGKTTPDWIVALANEKPSGHHRPTSYIRAVQIRSARLRVKTDQYLGLTTPQWIKDLANEPEHF